VTWKFELRKGVKFHNGNTFNAADVKFTFERMKDPQYSKLLNIANSIASIETPDDYTVIFKNVKPVPWFAETMHQNFIVDMESSAGRDDGDYNTKPIGTGAYKFVEWVKGSYVRMAANETTTGKARPNTRPWISDRSPKRPPVLPPWPANRPTSSTACPYP
jgi:peptide/nickel transport system substrate-binding protein